MAQTDAGQKEQLAKYKRVRRLKRLIIFVPFSTILFLIVMCFFLGIRLHIVKKELREALARLETTSVIDQTAAENELGADTEAPLYTVSEVEESGRKNVEIGTPQAEEDNIRKVYLTFDDGPSSNSGYIGGLQCEGDFLCRRERGRRIPGVIQKNS